MDLTVRQLLTSDSADAVRAAADDPSIELDVRLLMCGARLALDDGADVDRPAGKLTPWRGRRAEDRPRGGPEAGQVLLEHRHLDPHDVRVHEFKDGFARRDGLPEGLGDARHRPRDG